MPFNRWFVVVGALLIQINLGAIYIYSVFKPGLQARFPDWTDSDLSFPAQVIVVFESLSMIVAGKIHDIIGPKKTALAGAFILLLGMYVAAKAQTLEQFVLGFGAFAGIGVGAAYVCPIATCVKWFPDKRGLITGLAVAGFGAGGLIFAPLASNLISAFGIMPALFYLGLIYFISILFGAQLMNAPPPDFCPVGWMSARHQASFQQIMKTEFTPSEAAKTRQFWLLWLTYFIGCGAGLLVIMNIASVWQSIAAKNISNGFLMIQDNFAAIAGAAVAAVMAASILNSVGRIIWGKISDNTGRDRALVLIFCICAAALCLLAASASYFLFIVGVMIVGFCFGGFFALYPAITADYFGTKNIGANYGLLYSAYGAGGFIIPWLTLKSAAIFSSSGYQSIGANGYSVPFLTAAVACFVAAFLTSRLKTLKQNI